MQTSVKGMVQVSGITYRIARTGVGHYDVVRVLDDVCIGTFELGGRCAVALPGCMPELIREVARTALQRGRTSWAPGVTARV